MRESAFYVYIKTLSKEMSWTLYATNKYTLQIVNKNIPINDARLSECPFHFVWNFSWLQNRKYFIWRCINLKLFFFHEVRFIYVCVYVRERERERERERGERGKREGEMGFKDSTWFGKKDIRNMFGIQLDNDLRLWNNKMSTS